MTVFVDTSGFYAVLDRDEARHPLAREIWASLLSGAALLVTTNYIVLETLALLQRRLGMVAARAFVEEVLPAIHIEWVSIEDQEASLAALLIANRRHLSLVDCTSFQVLRRLGLRSVLAFDHHFEEQGFEPVVPPSV